jgi:hypothetical protein
LHRAARSLVPHPSIIKVIAIPDHIASASAPRSTEPAFGEGSTFTRVKSAVRPNAWRSRA